MITLNRDQYRGKPFDPQVWLARNPSGDVNEAIKQAQSWGMIVKQQ